MLYNVSFMLNGVDCANLVDADADMETVKEYFIHEHLNGDKNRFVGISENNESFHLSPCLSSVELLDNLSGSCSLSQFSFPSYPYINISSSNSLATIKQQDSKNKSTIPAIIIIIKSITSHPPM